MADTEYGTTQELNDFCGMTGEIPELPISSNDSSVESVGTGDGVTTRFFLDKSYVISGSYNLYAGTSVTPALSNELVETTQYTLDKDKGIITLTSNGLTSVSTSNLYADYKYNLLGIKDSEMQDYLNKAATRVDGLTNNHFVDGTAASPNWNVVSDEQHIGRGCTDKLYSLDNQTIANVTTTLSASVSAGATSVSVSSTNGFPSSGKFSLGTSKVSYTGKTATVFTGCTGVSASAVTAASVDNVIIEVSDTAIGSDPVFVVQTEGDEYNINRGSGNVTLMDSNTYPERLVSNRFRASYLWGTSIIPEDIKQLTLMVAGRQLMDLAVRKAHSNGINSFEPSVLDVDQSAIDGVVREYKRSYVKRI